MKQQLLEELLTAIEERVSAMQNEEQATAALDKAIANGNKAEILAKTAERIDAATDLMIATQKADQAYSVYLAYLKEDRKAVAADAN